MKLIEEYLGIEGNADKLVEKRDGPQEEEKPPIKPQEFDYQNYYADNAFNPRKEILKEKSMDEFFKVVLTAVINTIAKISSGVKGTS